MATKALITVRVPIHYLWNNLCDYYNIILGCGTLFSIDGNWKLCYPVCMYRVPKEVAGFEGKLSYVDTCPNGPLPGKAFCAHHCRLAEREGTPTGLRDFLRFCGIKLPSQLHIKFLAI